ncbi:MAG: tryptophan--tRNA ligase [Deltaproteobacteria bacterium GWA2_38_16]|nr:MAG: tryptophan--tRNA ligase [Deltaproteobacteria bacterium GWA2_38_16]OGQ03144.1 MAG: tryptophan--tRNA ligase [Deltaproteobacteria bacterium RIFCSPHIGHO2_02_FULL_38_15]OGQ61767.1 MAG: tryptophan--tRNA ligase [Deltaproteobacteria bacterium RIFCSPLOWO2_12_FULL_38_8]HBQ20433.1 tryptophan--tRNA ligase [Deltaproteobacteria bacterium]
MVTKKRVVSGKRSTGELHLGHYFGALKTWVSLQDQNQCFFFVADWHALTTDYQDPSSIEKYVLSNVADWLALEIDPKKSVIFIQSHVKEHAELYLLLSMMTPLGWLERNPTYKDQMKQLQNKDLSNLGFLGYPVLQAADILMYKGNLVPVGEDQIAHLELCREITRRFNYLYGDIFPEPESLLSPTPKIPGTDGRKMSNSYNNCIYLSDPKEVVTQKIMTMMTDPARKRRQDPGDPQKCPLFDLHEVYTESSVIKDVEQGCQTAKIGCIDCKKTLLERLLPWHASIYEKRQKYITKPKLIRDILEEGTKKATSEAQKTMGEVREKLKL